MFELEVEDIFTVNGLGTVFAGKVLTGSIGVGDRIVCRTPSGDDVAVRVISVQDANAHAVKRGETGETVAVVCNTVKMSFLGDGIGLRLVTAPEKKHWWQ